MDDSSSILSEEHTEDFEKFDDSDSEANKEKSSVSEGTRKQSSKDIESSMEDEVFLSSEHSSKPNKWLAAAQQLKNDSRKSSVTSMEMEMQEFPHGSGESHLDERKARRPQELSLHNNKRKRVKSLFLSDGAQHTVFVPKQASLSSSQRTFASFADNIAKKTPNSPFIRLKERQWELNCHTQATKEVFKEHTEELVNSYDGNLHDPKLTLKDVSKKVTERLHSNSQTTPKMASVVNELLHQRQQDLKVQSKEMSDVSHQPKMKKMSVPSIHHKPIPNKVMRQSSLDAALGNVVPISAKELLRSRTSQVST